MNTRDLTTDKNSLMNSLNILVASTNIVALYPINTSLSNKDYLTASIITFTAVASFISHLFESHKHGMTGFGCSPYYSYLLNRLDVFGVIVLGVRVAYHTYFYERIEAILHLNIIAITMATLLVGFLSEIDKNTDTKLLFVVLHSIWHCMAFWTLNLIMTEVYQ